MKRSNKGKGYFYAYGQLDKVLHGASKVNTAHMILKYRRGGKWPEWAKNAYYCGFDNL